MSPSRGLTLNAKVALAVAVAFAALMACFVAVLLPFQRSQRARLLEKDERLIATLREKYERDLIYDILSQNRESLAVDVADLARQPGLLWVAVDAKGMALSGTSDPDTKRHLLDGDETGNGSAALLVGEAGAALVSADGRITEIEPTIPPERVATWALPSRHQEAPGFQERPWPTGVPALHSDVPLRAADQVFGRLHIVYSLADLQRIERLTRNTAYLLATSVVVMLLLLLRAVLSRIVVRPVHAVAQAMERARAGDLSARVEIAPHDEIGAMAATFNEMAAELQGYSQTLERRVDERTRALRESEGRYRDVSHHLEAVIANAATGVVSLDPAGLVATFNHRAAEVLGLPESDLVGRSLEQVVSGREAAQLLPVVRHARERGVARERLSLRLPDGTRTLAVVATALQSVAGGERGVVVVLDDITEVLKSQRLDAWKEAVERVIHEIKNPLTPIGLVTETLRNAFASDRERFDALFPSASETVLKSVRDLRALISDFTRFSRMPPIVPTRQDLNAVVRDALAPYGADSEARGVVLKAELAEGPLEAEIDDEQFRRVLLNVLNNAFEAMEGRAGEIVVQTGERDGQALITVRDAGVGIEDPERLFEPYQTTKAKGTGLGLVISQQIVEEHGGRIEISSQPGVGTEVRISVPVRR